MARGQSGDTENMGNAGQLTLAFDLGAIPDEYGMFWCCGDCYPILQGGTSLVWQPPDYMVGECVICKRRYMFHSPKGKEELNDYPGA